MPKPTVILNSYYYNFRIKEPKSVISPCKNTFSNITACLRKSHIAGSINGISWGRGYPLVCLITDEGKVIIFSVLFGDAGCK